MYISLIICHAMIHHSGLQLQRLCAAVIGDLVRSPVLLPTLETSGSLRDFITRAVAVATTSTSSSSSSSDTPQYPLEPLLRALIAIATDHPPSRVALLAAFSNSSSSGNASSSNGTTAGKPLAALFSLALHPYPPAAAAAG
jgi:hypothetical protein